LTSIENYDKQLILHVFTKHKKKLAIFWWHFRTYCLNLVIFLINLILWLWAMFFEKKSMDESQPLLSCWNDINLPKNNNDTFNPNSNRFKLNSSFVKFWQKEKLQIKNVKRKWFVGFSIAIIHAIIIINH
jgi:hypothetical protein